MNRRDFVASLAATGAASLATRTFAQQANPLLDAKGQRIKLGMDNFAIRAFGWKGRELVDYASQQRLDVLFITDLAALGTDSETGCRELKAYAADKGIEILLGSWSICPTSKSFRKDWGTAEEHLAKGLRLSKAVGSFAFRVVLGAREDRRTPGGIEARIEDTVRVLKSQKSLAMDLGVKVAIENHAGDMTATELVSLIQAAGPDWVGANMDSGNAVWTLEDPIESLRILGPYAFTTSLRDSAIWQTEKGFKVQWTAFGEGGCVDWAQYFKEYARLCPGVAVNIETIGGFQVEFPVFEGGFWEAFPKKPASEFARFLAVARKGKPATGFDANNRDAQKGELERSIRYLRETIGLGARA